MQRITKEKEKILTKLHLTQLDIMSKQIKRGSICNAFKYDIDGNTDSFYKTVQEDDNKPKYSVPEYLETLPLK